MKKRILLTLLSIVCTIACALSLVACGDTPQKPPEADKPGTEQQTPVTPPSGGDTPSTPTPPSGEDNPSTPTPPSGGDTPSTPSTPETPVGTQGLAYTLNPNGNSYSVTGIGTATDTDIVIPSTYNGKPVTSIGAEAFKNRDEYLLTSISIPDSITNIGSEAFSGQSYLQYNEYENGLYLGNSTNQYLVLIKAKSTSITSCTINSNTKFIHSYAFSYCSNLTSITIPDSVMSIGYRTFSNCSKLQYTESKNGLYLGNSTNQYLWLIGVKDASITSFTINAGTKGIAETAIYECQSLTSINIPNSITSICDVAFYGCSGLESITVDSGNTKYSSNGNCLIETATKTLVVGCKNSVIPTDGSVTSIGMGAFFYCSSLTNITIPDSVTSIGYMAFAYCSGLTSISIPNSVTSIGYMAFAYCSGLTSISIPNSVTSIGERAFYNCDSLTSIAIPNSVTSIGKEAFCHCDSLTSITIPDSITSIGYMAFSYCSKLQYTEYENVLYLGDSTNPYLVLIKAKSNDITSCTISSNTRFIYDGAFYDRNSLTSIYYTGDIASWCKISGLYNLMSYGASGRKLYINNTEITGDLVIPNSVKSIGSGAFYKCGSLTSITIPDSVTSIGGYAFYDCGSLMSIYYTGEIASWCKISGLDNLMSYGVSGRKLYINNTEITGDLVIPNSVKSIGSGAFYKCSNLTSITIPDSVTSIGEWAFYGCSNLTSITIPDSVTSIGGYAFYDCGSLTSITIPDSVTSIGEWAFYGCSNLTSITIPDSVTSIGGYAFYDCGSLTSIIIPNSVTSIGGYAFNQCEALTIYCEATTKPSGWNSSWNYSSCPVVWDCKNNDKDKDGYAYSVIDGIRYSLKDGEATVVKQPRNITTVTIPSSVTYKGSSYSVKSIGDSAFYWCSSLTSITIPDSVTSIGGYAFSGCSNLTSITIPDSVTSIGGSAFSGCSNLTSITIPDSVTSIGGYAFSGCNALTIYCEATTKPSGWNSSWNYSSCPVVWDCKNNDKDKDGYAYSVIDGMRYSLKDGVATVIRQPRNITTATVPSSVTYKGSSYSVTSIGDDAFYECRNLTSITIPNSVTSIGSGAFEYCSSLTSVTIPSSVKIIGDDAFYWCSLTSITFQGTKAQWNAIVKGSDWDHATGNYVIHCTDGDIAKG